MKEAHFNVEETLRNGLSPEVYLQPNAPYLDRMTNMRPTAHGARRYESIAQPFTATVEHPFPHLFHGLSESLLFFETSIETVDPSDWSTTPVVETYSLDSWLTPKAIVAGGPWHVLDFGPTWLAMNGSCIVCKTGYSNKIFVSDAVSVTTGCTLNESRAFMGGFDSADFWRSAWQTFWDSYTDTLPDEIDSALDFSAGASQNWVWWSTIGTGDLLWLWDATLMVYGSYAASPELGYDEDNPYIFDLLRRNEMGLAPMPFRGQIYRMLPLGDRVVVYGSDGANLLQPIQSPVPTMATRDIQGLERGIGAAGRGCVGGGTTRHVMIDNDAVLWLIAPTEHGQIAAQRLGYETYLSALTLDDTVISYDPDQHEFWICDGTYAYVLTPRGLGGPMDLKPTSMARTESGLVGPRVDSTQLATKFDLRTAYMDLGERDYKHTSAIQMQARDVSNARAAMAYRYNQGSFDTSASTPFNLQHVAFPRATWVDGKVQITGTADGPDAAVHRLEVRYNAEGKRYRRGTKGVPTEN